MAGKKYRRGLVVGKFFPPHKGHKLLIDTAIEQCENVTVMVCQRTWEKPTASLRAHWIRQIHKDFFGGDEGMQLRDDSSKVIVIHNTLPDDDSKLWADFTINTLGYAPDAVFSSEDYGNLYAEHMGAVHVCVDKARLQVPISGTLVRSGPLGYFDYLEPIVRGYYVRRFCVVGAESTGTTTLARGLAQYFDTYWVPEYGRLYTEQMPDALTHEWRTQEFTHIAEMQITWEDQAAELANKVLICDTDPFATQMFHITYMGERSADVDYIVRDRTYRLYFLTSPDGVEYEDDGMRKPAYFREKMHRLFVDELTEANRPFVEIVGSRECRLASAASLINKILRNDEEIDHARIASIVQAPSLLLR
jgi:HTH-type transcriptional repressor of NAD biosynthesis genes